MSEMPNCVIPTKQTMMGHASCGVQFPGASRPIKEFNEFLRIPGDNLTECIRTGWGLTKVSKIWLETAWKVQWNVPGCTIGETKCIQ
jgi:hypothetical protein